MKWYWQAFKKYATFSGRARRSEFWFFMLFQFLLCVISCFLLVISALTVQNLSFGDLFVGIESILMLLLFLATLIPSLAVTVRRLHDVGISGWWIPVVPTIFGGSFAMLIKLDNDMAGFIFMFVLILTLFLTIFMFVKLLSPGERVTNRYGIDPKENDNLASFFE